MGNGYYVNKFQGDVRPVRKSKSAPPIWQEEIRIGELDTPNSHLWTTFRLYIRPATLQYPQAGLFLSFGNGEHFAFSRLNQGDLTKIKNFLEAFQDEAESIHRDEIRKGVLIEEQRKQLDIISAMSNDGDGQQTVQDLTQQIISQLQSSGKQLPIGLTPSNISPEAGIQPNLNTSPRLTTFGDGQQIVSEGDSIETKTKKEKKSSKTNS